MRISFSLKASVMLLAVVLQTRGASATEFAWLTNPAPNSVANSLRVLGGAVSPGAFQRGAKIAIYRLSDGRRWVPGTGWNAVSLDEISRYGDGSPTTVHDSSFTALPGIEAEIVRGALTCCDGSWTWGWRIANGPSGTALLDGRYFVRTFGIGFYLGALPGAQGFYVTVDSTRPTVAITSPVSGATLAVLDNIHGTASDNPGGSGLKAVTFTLRRNVDGLYWNGISWLATPVSLPARLARDQWTPAGSLPTGGALPNGGYTLSASVVDLAGNTAASLPIFVTINSSETFVGFIVPRSGEVLVSFENLAGSAYDLSGIRNVDVYLQRLSDLLYWNGVSWQGDPALLPATYSSAIFSRTTGLPTGGQLLSGDYEIGVTARGNAGGIANDVIRVRIDRAPPLSVTFDYPTDGEWLNTLVPPRGRAVDDPAGSGISTVLVTMFRETDGRYWAGTIREWVNEPTGVPANLTAPYPETPGVYRWSANEVRDGVEIVPLFREEGRYRLTARAFDFSGQSVSNTIHVSVDNTAPAVAITDPLEGAFVSELRSIGGTAADEVNGSGLERVSVVIQRRRDFAAWDGSGWNPLGAGSLLPAVAFGGIWLRVIGLPAPVDLEEGDYTIQAYAVDRAGNTTVAQHRITVDKTAPLIAFSAPTDGARIGALASIVGTVSDSASGVRSVVADLQRVSDGHYWNGSAWQTAPAETSAAFTSATWQWVYGLPSGTDLPDGDYRLTAAALDAAGNRASTAILVHIDGSYPLVTITVPAHGLTNYCPSAAKGTASDSSGVEAVWVYLYRSAYGARPPGFYNFNTATWGAILVSFLPAPPAQTPGSRNFLTWRRETMHLVPMRGTIPATCPARRFISSA